AAPSALDLGKIFGHRADRAVLLDERCGDLIERLEQLRMGADTPIPVRHNVVAGAGLRLSGRRQLVLLALRGDEIDFHLDIVFSSPREASVAPEPKDVA